MNGTSGNRAALFLLALLLSSSSNAAGGSCDAAQIVGRWEKEFVVQKDVRTQDPRWKLTLFFVKDGQFRYSSKSTTEMRLSNGSARPIVEEIVVEGKWSVNREGKTIVRFDRELKDSETENLRVNLNFEPKTKMAVVKCDSDGGLMRLSGPGRDRQIFFKRAPHPS